MFSFIAIIVVGLLILNTIAISMKYPHLRKMAVRNLLVHKQTTMLTMIGAMVGTALITTSLLIDHSISQSINRVYEEQIGDIVGDVSAIHQRQLTTPFFTEDDIIQMKRDNEAQDWPVAGILPIVSSEFLLMKLNEDNQPIILNPKTYVFGTDEMKITEFRGGLQLSSNEIILSERTANILEADHGSEVVIVDDNGKWHSLTVKKVVPEQGLTGYRGINKGTATAIISAEKARALLNIDREGYTNVITFKSASSGKTDYYHPYSPGRNWETVNVAIQLRSQLERSTKLLPIFTIASFTAIVIGMVLIINVFKMVAEERRREFGILRAIGLSKTDLSKVLKIEGSIYAISAGIIGISLGIGLAYMLVLRIRDLLAFQIQYSSGLNITYNFSVDILSLLSGFSIGFLLVYICIFLITNRAVAISIVSAIGSAEGENLGRPLKRLSLVRIGIIVVLSIAVISLFLITQSTNFIEFVRESPIQPLIIIVISFLLLFMLMLIFSIGMSVVFSIIKKLVQMVPKLNGVMKLAFRYPEVNPIRTSMLIFMFSLVLFLTSFSGVFSKTMEGYFSAFNRETATAGYDLLARNINGSITKGTIEKMVANSIYVDADKIEEISLVSQLKIIDYYDAINGIDEAFAKGNTISLLNKSNEYETDRKVWEAIMEDPHLVVVSEFRNRNWKVNDIINLQTEAGLIPKKLIAIANYEGDSYEYPTSYGMWMSEEAMQEMISDERQLVKTALIKVNRNYSIGETANQLEKEFTLNNIFPLINPIEMATSSGAFIAMFFSLFEGFNALATIIGIVGLMIIMMRVIRERRQQIGMLRAIGVSPKIIYWSYIIEGGVLAIIGITIGMFVGAYGGNLMLQTLMNDGKEEIQRVAVVFPYLKIAGYYFAAIILTLLFIAIPARTTLRLSPAEASKYVS